MNNCNICLQHFEQETRRFFSERCDDCVLCLKERFDSDAAFQSWATNFLVMLKNEIMDVGGLRDALEYAHIMNQVRQMEDRTIKEADNGS